MLVVGCETAKNVFPEPSPEPTVLVVRPTVSLLKDGGSTVVDVATNATDWTASVKDALGWVTLSRSAEGVVPGQLTITVTENNVMDERSAYVMLTAAGGSLKDSIRVVQFGTTKKILFNQGARKTIKGAGETFELEVLTNCPEFDWVIDPTCDWITDVTPQGVSKAFEDWTSTRKFEVGVNPLEASRTAIVSAVGKGLGFGASADITIEQSPNVAMVKIPAKFVSYSGQGAATMENIFDGLFTTYGETSYQASGEAPSTTLDMDVKADKLFQITFYPRNYDPTQTPVKLGSVAQYPADMELWVKKANTDWEKVQDVQIRGTGIQGPTKKYPNLIASEVPYYIYDGAALADVRQVRFVITSGNSATGENNQFWNASEIQFLGVPATVLDPVQAPIISAAYSWVSSDVNMPNGDGGALSLLYDGIKSAANYWQTPYSKVTAEQAAEKGKVGSTDDVAASGTTLTLNLDKGYSNFSELRYYIRNNGTQVPKVFEIWVDPGNGIYKKVKDFTIAGSWTALPGYTSIKLDAPVAAKSVQIYVKETAIADQKMFMCASEIEAYIQP